MGMGNAWPTLPRSPQWPPSIGKVLACLVLSLALAVGPDALGQGRSSNPTGKGAIQDNSVYCQNSPGQPARPEYRGTGSQNPFGGECGPGAQPRPPLQATVTYDETEDGNFLRGVSKGFAACADGLRRAIGSTLVAGVQFLSGDFIGAEQSLGLERGRGMIQRLVTYELSQPAVNATPEEAGERIARRICQYVLIPEAANAARVGGTPFNPVRGPAVNANWKGLQGKWVEIGEQGQVVQLGLLKGNGAYGAVYQNAGTAGQVVKIMNPANDMAASITGQVQGMFRAMQAETIPVPKIWNYRLGRNGEPAFIVMEDVNQMYPNLQPKWFSSGNGMTAADLEATRLLHDQIGQQGLLWADANAGNVFTVTLEDGTTIAGIADADMIFPAAELGQQPVYIQQHVRALIEPLEPMAQPFVPAQDPVLGVLLRDPTGIDARAVMNQMYQTRRAYGHYGPPP